MAPEWFRLFPLFSSKSDVFLYLLLGNSSLEASLVGVDRAEIQIAVCKDKNRLFKLIDFEK